MLAMIVLLGSALAQTPGEIQSRAQELYARGDLAEARRLLESLVASEPGFAPARFQLAAVYLRLGSFDQAAKLFESVVAEHPGNAELSFRIGLAYLLEKRSAEANELSASARSPASPSAALARSANGSAVSPELRAYSSARR